VRTVCIISLGNTSKAPRDDVDNTAIAEGEVAEDSLLQAEPRSCNVREHAMTANDEQVKNSRGTKGVINTSRFDQSIPT
jgi:hypothetical protein